MLVTVTGCVKWKKGKKEQTFIYWVNLPESVGNKQERYTMPPWSKEQKEQKKYLKEKEKKRKKRKERLSFVLTRDNEMTRKFWSWQTMDLIHTLNWNHLVNKHHITHKKMENEEKGNLI
jgi:hypothetical protein